MPGRDSISEALRRVRDGEEGALDRLVPLIYDDLRRLARAQLARRAPETLDTAGVVHETYLKLAAHRQAAWRDRGHFFAGRRARSAHSSTVSGATACAAAAPRSAGRTRIAVEQEAGCLLWSMPPRAPGRRGRLAGAPSMPLLRRPERGQTAEARVSRRTVERDRRARLAQDGIDRRGVAAHDRRQARAERLRLVPALGRRPARDPAELSSELGTSDALTGEPTVDTLAGKAVEMVGAYRLLRPLGSGGQADVFLAYDTRLERHVAIKRIRAGRRLSEHARERLRREAAAAATINHPAVVQIYDILDEPDGQAIVMEYAPGPTLARALAEGALDAAQAIGIARQVAEGLAQPMRWGCSIATSRRRTSW
jgi:hypothetical protein